MIISKNNRKANHFQQQKYKKRIILFYKKDQITHVTSVENILVNKKGKLELPIASKTDTCVYASKPYQYHEQRYVMDRRLHVPAI